jgi:hypothetical protein
MGRWLFLGFAFVSLFFTTLQTANAAKLSGGPSCGEPLPFSRFEEPFLLQSIHPIILAAQKFAQTSNSAAMVIAEPTKNGDCRTLTYIAIGIGPEKTQQQITKNSCGTSLKLDGRFVISVKMPMDVVGCEATFHGNDKMGIWSAKVHLCRNVDGAIQCTLWNGMLTRRTQ